MEDSSTEQHQQDTNGQVTTTIKAEERRRRLADMMGSSGNNNNNKTLTPGTAVFTARQQRQKSSTHQQTEGTTVPPPELSDLESKALARREQVARLIQTESETATTRTTNGLTTLESDIAAKQQLPRDSTVTHRVGACAQKTGALLPSKQKHAGRGVTDSNNNAAASPLTTLDDAIAEKQRLNSTHNANAKSRGLATLRGAEQTALQKHRLPRAIPDPSQQQQQHSTKSLLDNNNNDPTEMTTMTAELVDDEQDRKKIVAEAHADLISKAVVASSVKTVEDTTSERNSCGTGGCGVLLLLVVVVAVAAVCGSGSCANSSSRLAEDPVQRAAAITDLVNAMTFLPSSIQYPATINNTNVTTTPEEEALEFLIDNDALQLSVASGDSSRLIQRYAMTVLWYTNGPWSPSDEAADPQSAWFAQPNECQWLGVVCNDEGLLVQLHLSDQGMRGHLPADLALLKHMTYLGLELNQLTGTIPTVLAELTSLEQLDLSFNKLTGPAVPPFLEQLSNLQQYTVGINKMNGTLPDFLGKMTQLNALSIDFNKLSGTIPDFLGDMTGLTRLNVGANQLTGTIPSAIFERLTGLENVNVGGREHDGSPSLLPLSGLRKLTQLAYIGSDFGGVSLPDDLGDWWPNMTTISFVRANFTGRIPSSVVKWKYLTSISFSFNKLSGSLPPGIFNTWSNLTLFSMGLNDLTGTLPQEIGMWSNLKYFDIRRNAFRGTLPTTVGLMTSLGGFVVTGNQLSGVIPSEAKNFGWYDDNNFTGTAPFCSAGASTVSARVDCELVLCECCSSCE